MIARPAGPRYVSLFIDPELALRPVDRAAHGFPVRVRRAAPPIGLQPASNPPAAAQHVDPVDFGDPESQRVLSAAAWAVARELGRNAAREYFAELMSAPRIPK